MTQPTRIQTIPAAERDRATYMPLNQIPSSEEAIAFARELAERLFNHRGTAKRGRPSSTFVNAVGALLGDLLHAAEKDSSGWGYCSHRRDAFVGHRVGYRVFKDAFDALADQKLLQYAKGHQQRGALFGVQAVTWGRTTRSRATSALLELASEAGLSPSNFQNHFRVIETPRPA